MEQAAACAPAQLGLCSRSVAMRCPVGRRGLFPRAWRLKGPLPLHRLVPCLPLSTWQPPHWSGTGVGDRQEVPAALCLASRGLGNRSARSVPVSMGWARPRESLPSHRGCMQPGGSAGEVHVVGQRHVSALAGGGWVVSSVHAGSWCWGSPDDKSEGPKICFRPVAAVWFSFLLEMWSAD